MPVASLAPQNHSWGIIESQGSLRQCRSNKSTQKLLNSWFSIKMTWTQWFSHHFPHLSQTLPTLPSSPLSPLTTELSQHWHRHIHVERVHVCCWDPPVRPARIWLRVRKIQHEDASQTYFYIYTVCVCWIQYINLYIINIYIYIYTSIIVTPNSKCLENGSSNNPRMLHQNQQRDYCNKPLSDPSKSHFLGGADSGCRNLRDGSCGSAKSTKIWEAHGT